MTIPIKPIGVIRSSFKNALTGGRQPAINGKKGRVVLYEEFLGGLAGLEDFSHIIVLYHFHRQTQVKLRARPCFDKNQEHGIFASRFPTRPNHIGLSVLTLDSIQSNVLHCLDVDVLDGTPLLDIKPYVKQFDRMPNPRSGWYDRINWQAL